jgi:hypothetical protein
LSGLNRSARRSDIVSAKRQRRANVMRRLE